MKRMHLRRLDCSGLTLQEAEQWGDQLCKMQRDIPWMIGDLARYCESQWPDTWQQVFPEWASPGMVDRYKGVARAYSGNDDRNCEATFTQYMQAAGKPNRIELLERAIDKGQTSDESRKALTEDRTKQRWLLAVDANFWITKHYYSGAEIEAAMQVSEWIKRTVERLQRYKGPTDVGLTDVAICFDSSTNFRKQLTEGKEWEGPRYKDRPPKPDILVQQLHLGRGLLEKAGFLCVSNDGYEADDVIASYTAQRDDWCSVLGVDKDLYQLLNDHVNMLTDVTWVKDPTSGELQAMEHWVTSQSFTEEGCTYNSVLVQGIPPKQWPEFQTLAGDSTDGVTGAVGIGATIAANLIKEFGTAEAAIQAAKDEDERIKPAKRKALIEFEPKLDVTRQLVTLRTDLPIPTSTRI